jgi:hypothetical protein
MTVECLLPRTSQCDVQKISFLLYEQVPLD